MPYLTPQELPGDDDCRPLFIPADTEWLALFGGALTELTKKYNWEYSGGLTVDETVAKMNEIMDGWYTEPCASCTLPGGGRIIRIGAGGHLEELGDDGSWSDPTGDYVIPPPAERTGGTATDQTCLAAKNAVNVLEQLYEELSEAWASHLSEAEALTEFTIALIAIVGFEFAPITFAVVAFFEVAFAALYTALEYLGADLWDESFTDQMVCFLINCATNDSGVITFDWDCLMAELNSLTDSFGLTELQIRLYLQVSYILYFIGGIDGLNLAGGTTEITDDNCEACDQFCGVVDFRTGLHGWTILTGVGGTRGHYEPGVGIVADVVDTYPEWYVYRRDIDTTNIRKYEIFGHHYMTGTPGGRIDFLLDNVPVIAQVTYNPPGVSGEANDWHEIWVGDIDVNGLNTDCTEPGGGALEKIVVRGVGDLPAWLEPCAD